ncbi:MAG: hypothetical protein F6K56_03190 [Moorea sp. SIO3G5]|nr:hypothetical protein [Moorena sp. SIO3G5]
MNAKKILRALLTSLLLFAAVFNLSIGQAVASGDFICPSSDGELIAEGCFAVPAVDEDGVTYENSTFATVTYDFSAAGLWQAAPSYPEVGPNGNGNTSPYAKYPDLSLFSLVVDCSNQAPEVLGQCKTITLESGESCKFIKNDGKFDDNLGAMVVSYGTHE